MLYERLNDLYKNGKYREYIVLFEKNIDECYQLDFLTICRYGRSLIQLHRFDDGYSFLRKLETLAITDDEIMELAFNYYYMKRSDEVIRVLGRIEKPLPKKMYLLALAYMLNGEIREAKQYIRYIYFYYQDTPWASKSRELMYKIINHRDNGAFIEMNYNSFIKRGNHLEEGHIVYIKDGSLMKYANKYDSKYYQRPYLILKIVDDMLYLAPITTRGDTCKYILYAFNYPNNDHDRYVNNSFCMAGLDNVLSVCDKLKEGQLTKVINYIGNRLYFNMEVEEGAKRIFYNTFFKHYEVGEVIAYSYPIANQKLRYYYVLGKNDKGYYGYEVSFGDFEKISDEVVYIENDATIYKRIKPNLENSKVRIKKP